MGGCRPGARKTAASSNCQQELQTVETSLSPWRCKGYYLTINDGLYEKKQPKAIESLDLKVSLWLLFLTIPLAYLRVWRLCILFPFLQLVLMQKSPVCSSLEDIFACKIEFQNTHTGPIKVWRTRLKLLFLYQRQSSELISRQYKNCCVYSLSPHWLIHFFSPNYNVQFFLKYCFLFPTCKWMCHGCHLFSREMSVIDKVILRK